MTLMVAVDRESKLMLNLTRGTVVCERMVIADRPARRMRGLLGRQSLPLGEGMLLAPTPSIHTAFMRFSIDVILMDGTFRVLKIVRELPAWRAASAHRARAVLELAAGEAERRGVAVSDQLGVVEVSDRLGAVNGGAWVTAATAPPVLMDVSGQTSETTREPFRGAVPIGRGAPAADAPRVLIIGHDRRFRSVAAVLLARRSCAVTLGAPGANVTELVRREYPDVVLIEADGSLTAAARDAAQIETLDPPVGVVIVGDECDPGLSTMPVLPKWGSFDDLWTAIQQARPESGSARAADAWG
jgi:uncharacterized membrane protein (UPF0127 family)